MSCAWSGRLERLRHDCYYFSTMSGKIARNPPWAAERPHSQFPIKYFGGRVFDYLHRQR
jgi:hypothetical protein